MKIQTVNNAVLVLFVVRVSNLFMQRSIGILNPLKRDWRISILLGSSATLFAAVILK